MLTFRHRLHVGISSEGSYIRLSCEQCLSISAGRQTIVIIVIQVRLPYMSALFAAKEALLVQQTEHAKQLAELQASHQCTATLKSGSPRDGGIAKEALASSAQTIVGDSEAEVSNGDGEDLALLEPQKGHELLVICPISNVCGPGSPRLA